MEFEEFLAVILALITANVLVRLIFLSDYDCNAGLFIDVARPFV